MIKIFAKQISLVFEIKVDLAKIIWKIILKMQYLLLM